MKKIALLLLILSSAGCSQIVTDDFIKDLAKVRATYQQAAEDAGVLYDAEFLIAKLDTVALEERSAEAVLSTVRELCPKYEALVAEIGEDVVVTEDMRDVDRRVSRLCETAQSPNLDIAAGAAETLSLVLRVVLAHRLGV